MEIQFHISKLFLLHYKAHFSVDYNALSVHSKLGKICNMVLFDEDLKYVRNNSVAIKILKTYGQFFFRDYLLKDKIKHKLYIKDKVLSTCLYDLELK